MHGLADKPVKVFGLSTERTLRPTVGMPTQALLEVRELLVEVNDLKRVTSAGQTGSIATRLFSDAWAALSDGAPSPDVTRWITGRALAATRLGDMDRHFMIEAGLSSAEASEVLGRAIDATLGNVVNVAAELRTGVVLDLPNDPAFRPNFVDALARQPRAGITCPGKPRVLLEPPENHADHCLVVAVYGVLLAPVYNADPARVFLAALAHHFHNAGMPDSGFTGEMLLGHHLETVVAHHTQTCLRQLASPLREQVEEARSILPDADGPDGRAFHAADVLDRVLQTLQYQRAGALSAEQVLGEMELVHAGPVKEFQDDVLRQAGLL